MSDITNNASLGYQAYIKSLQNEMLLTAAIAEMGLLNPKSVKAIYKNFHLLLESKITDVENSNDLSPDQKQLELSILKQFRNIYK